MRHFKAACLISVVILVCLGLIFFYEKESMLAESSRKYVKFKPLKTKKENVNTAQKSPLCRCKNLLNNLTRGKWKRNPSGNVSYYDALFGGYWKSKKMLNHLWRGDGKCGLENPQAKIEGSRMPEVPSWCDPYGEKPCCSNADDGVCSLPSDSTCECQGCVDLKKYKYAEISEWKTEDPRCKWTNYSSTQACDVIRESPYDDIYFVGDSLMRNMFMSLSMLLSGDAVRGAWGKRMTEEQKQICVAEEFFFWDWCRTILTNLDELIYPEKLCGGTRPRFAVSMLVYYNKAFGVKFLNHVNGLLGKNGTLIVLGVGLHFHLNANATIGDFVHPAVEAIEDFYKGKNASASERWPRIFFVLPLDPGILKSKVHLTTQSKAAVGEFSSRMGEYCRQHEIPLFDFRQLSHHVHSFDGTHFGLGVNLMKNQVLLNYFAGEANESDRHAFS